MIIHNPERYYTSTTNITTVPVSRQYPEEKALPCLGILVGIEASPTNGGSTEITPPPAPSNPFEHHGNKGRAPRLQVRTCLPTDSAFWSRVLDRKAQSGCGLVSANKNV